MFVTRKCVPGSVRILKSYHNHRRVSRFESLQQTKYLFVKPSIDIILPLGNEIWYKSPPLCFCTTMRRYNMKNIQDLQRKKGRNTIRSHKNSISRIIWRSRIRGIVFRQPFPITIAQQKTKQHAFKRNKILWSITRRLNKVA